MKKYKSTVINFIFLNLFFIQAVPAQKSELEYEFLYEIEATLDSTIVLGKTSLGNRMIHPVTGGSFEGPKIKGEVLPIGADWALSFDSGIKKLDVDIVLKTDDDALIYVTYTGFIYPKEDGSLYFRVVPIFETSSEKYYWLNHTIAVGIGRRIEGGVAYTVYAIK
ncbi:DUF3237 domain-containing protein [Maribacter halichondriae]|uniref:DUF3237 domain-containing protein n=1 Tax=Maribacter halichondriae TaxID=2980554 RepID=UPI0023590E6E|nr:DUF3237 domain-containing protein [Maribacter sp. Hal144]